MSQPNKAFTPPLLLRIASNISHSRRQPAASCECGAERLASPAMLEYAQNLSVTADWLDCTPVGCAGDGASAHGCRDMPFRQ
eukprot:915834-Amphidinium_carterae.1